MKASTSFSIQEMSQVGEARRFINELTGSIGFDETERGKIAIVTTELGTNILKHAVSGEIIVRPMRTDEFSGVEILGLDQGPGIKNINECMRDGYSTVGSSGTGLGAIQRLAHRFDLYSFEKKGTGVFVQFGRKTRPTNTNPTSPFAFKFFSPYQVGVVNLPRPGEEGCGDGWGVYQNQQRSLFMVADGLGHGLLAGEASHEFLRVFLENTHRHPTEILELAHISLKRTRGAAAAIALIEGSKKQLCFSGIGNIAGVVITPTSTDIQQKSMVSINGTVGAEIRKTQEFLYSWEKNSLLILHSDGLSSQWNIEDYPGLIRKHPSLIAGILYRDFKRIRDDMTILVARAEL